MIDQSPQRPFPTDLHFMMSTHPPLEERIADIRLERAGHLRVLLLNCSLDSSDSVGSSLGQKTILPPLGLGYIGSSLVQAGVREIRYLDAVDRNSLHQSLRDFRPHLVACYATTASYMQLINSVADVRLLSPRSMIIVGGPHSAAAADEMLAVSGIDATFIGDGELSTSRLVQVITGQCNLNDVPGMNYRVGGRLASNQPGWVANLDDLVMPMHSLFDFSRNRLSPAWGPFDLPIASIITSRGCPFACSYCSVSQPSQPALRERSVLAVMEEVDFLIRRYGIRTLAFWDDTFTASRNRTLWLCENLARRKVSWYCNTRIDRVDADLLRTMKSSGCIAILYGVESLSTRVQESLHRGLDIHQILDCLALTTQIGIRPIVSLMLGTPNDDESTIAETVDCIRKVPTPYIRASVFNVLPGTEIYHRAVSEGVLTTPVSWGAKDRFPGPPEGLPVFSKSFNRFQLQEKLDVVAKAIGARQAELGTKARNA